MKTVVYDPELEKEINDTSPQRCFFRFKLLMKWDSVGEEFYDAVKERNRKMGKPKLQQSRRFFYPENTKVACSNTYHCSRELDYRHFYNFPEMVGKTVQFHGKCVIYGDDVINRIPATGIREMSKQDQIDLLMSAINWDRKEIGDQLNIKMNTMSYAEYKEKNIIWTEECQQVLSNKSLILSGDKDGRAFLERYQSSNPLFFPSLNVISCSKDFICTYTIPTDLDDKELAGKTVEFYGVCVFEIWYNTEVSDEDLEKLNNAEFPKPWKYGDIIGVPGPLDNSASLISSAERYLSVEVQNKLINAINEDIKIVAQKTNLTIKPLKYSPYLERTILWAEDCYDPVAHADGPWLSGDSNARKLLDTYHGTAQFFDPEYETIGCSPNFNCKREYSDKDARDLNITSNIVEFRGICIFGEEHGRLQNQIFGKITLPELPKLSKYWDIIASDEPDSTGKVGVSGGGEGGEGGEGGGNQNSGAGSAVTLLCSLFLVLYI
ncbi:hypothetical protein CAEBREN_14612 [Caenorhabditis brenneri]|uniref:Uncharacterized protein n=1 Tax=Caenorhabditis brenneri TaxID=135651 RepID=G0N7E4_CAEBE|nr:hypothetical protein CAEBREN_14612 [Caenorhabditis brenneri]